MHTAVEIGVETQNESAIGDGLNQLGNRYSICGKEDDGWDSGGSAVGRESGGGVSGGGAANADDGAVHFAEAIYLADQDGHAQILETPGVADPAVLDPELAHAQELFAETLGPEEVGVALEGADDVVAVDLREDPLLLGPDAGSIGPCGLAHAGVEEIAPVLTVVVF